MKWSDGCRIRLFLIGFTAALTLSSGGARARFIFGEPVNLGPIVNSSSADHGPSLSADGLTLYFSSERPGGSGASDIWMTTRETLDSEWTTPVNLGPTVNSSAIDIEPDISADGLELYFESWHKDTPRPGNVSYRADIWVTKRATKDHLWGPPVNLVPLVSTAAIEAEPSISSDGLELFFVGDPLDVHAVYVATREDISAEWGAPALAVQANPPAIHWSPDISANGRVLFFARTDGFGGDPGRLWLTMRDSVSSGWNPPIEIGPPINTDSSQLGTTTSADGRFLLFDSDRPGGQGDYDIWQAQIIPIVDFNSDGEVNRLDVGLLMVNWGTNESLYDIGPTPLGDGIVDCKDLMVLAEHGAFLAGDANFDGVVDLLDLAELAKNWLQDNNP